MNHSDNFSELVTALAKARKEFKPVLRSSFNTYFNSYYAELGELVEATKDALSDNGLVMIQSPNFNYELGVTVETWLMHSSGQWFRDDILCPVKKTVKDKDTKEVMVLDPDAQTIGTAITYLRRYAYGAMLNLASEADDDGNAAADRKPEKKQQKPAPKPAPPKSELTEEQKKLLKPMWAKVGEVGMPKEDFRKYLKETFGFESTALMTPEQVSSTIDFLKTVQEGQGS